MNSVNCLKRISPKKRWFSANCDSLVSSFINVASSLVGLEPSG
jgi:hypothetical protein